jgi:enamine deaminase RidA (YjgF/YER057c/UK114 family)
MTVGGWNPETGDIDSDVSAQMDQAFKNVQVNLTHDPIWTVLGVSKLGEDAMKVETDVFAHIPN